MCWNQWCASSQVTTQRPYYYCRNLLKLLFLVRFLQFVFYSSCFPCSFPIEVRARVTLARMRTAMRNARMASYPQPPPRTLRELTAILQDPRYEVLTATLDNEDNIYAGSVTDVRGDHHILFASRRSLDHLATCNWIHGDGTIKIVPALDGVSQVRVKVILLCNYVLDSHTNNRTVIGICDCKYMELPCSWPCLCSDGEQDTRCL